MSTKLTAKQTDLVMQTPRRYIAANVGGEFDTHGLSGAIRVIQSIDLTTGPIDGVIETSDGVAAWTPILGGTFAQVASPGVDQQTLVIRAEDSLGKIRHNLGAGGAIDAGAAVIAVAFKRNRV